MNDIKILIPTLKEVTFPKGKYFYPIQVGAKMAPYRFDGMLHDDEGDNISGL